MNYLAIDAKDMTSILKEVTINLETHSEELNTLDAVLGDGDLGMTMQIGGRAVLECLNSADDDDIGRLLTKCGTSFYEACAGTFGILIASVAMEAGKACAGMKKIESEDFLVMGNNAVEGIKKRGRSEIGEKTMLDSLVPAIEAFKEQVDMHNDPRTALEAAVQAAEAGMKATVNMRAKYGRASWYKDGGVGVQDAGATAIFYMIKSFVRALISHINP